MVGLTRFELVTSRLSGERSNQLSYRPEVPSRKERFDHARDSRRANQEALSCALNKVE